MRVLTVTVAHPSVHGRPSSVTRRRLHRSAPIPPAPGLRAPGTRQPSPAGDSRGTLILRSPGSRVSALGRRGLGSLPPGSRLSGAGFSALGRRVLGSRAPGSRLSAPGLSALGRRALGSRPPGARDRGLPEAQPAGDGASSAVNFRHQRRVNQYGNEVCNISYTCTSPPSHLPRTTDSGIPARPRKADHDRESVSLRQSIGRHGTIERNQRREARRQPAVAMATNS